MKNLFFIVLLFMFQANNIIYAQNNIVEVVDYNSKNAVIDGSSLKNSDKAIKKGEYSVKINTSAFKDFSKDSQFLFQLPNGEKLKIKLKNTFLSRNDGKIRSYSGYVEESGDNYQFLLTINYETNSSFGRLLTQDDEFIIETSDAGQIIKSIKETGLKIVPGNPDDAKIPPFLPDDFNNSHFIEKDSLSSPFASATFDLMVLYPPSLASRYPSTLQTRIQGLVDLMNQAFADSGVDARMRLVHTHQVSYYADSTGLDPILDALTTHATTPSHTIYQLRSQYGADFIIFVRPFNMAVDNYCGLGWINGWNQHPEWLSKDNAISVMNEGNDITPGSYYLCSDLSLAHEIGHTMGLAHDLANGGGNGVYSYSNGYGISGSFGTIMSYIDPRIVKYSNPNITTCNDYACGASNANCVLSINNLKTTLAAFMPQTVSDKYQIACDLNSDSQSDILGYNNQNIWYSTNFSSWTGVSASLLGLTSGDMDGEGKNNNIIGLFTDHAIWWRSSAGIWVQIPGSLTSIAAGDFDKDAISGVNDDIIGLNNGAIWYTTNLGTSWTNIPGYLTFVAAGDFDSDGYLDDLIGLNNGSIWYTTNLGTSWNHIPGYLTSLAVGDFDKDGYMDDLIGLNNGSIWRTTNLGSSWTNISGYLSFLAR